MVARKNAGKSPEQLRYERAVTEYHSFKFNPQTVTVRYHSGEVRKVGVVYVSSPSGSLYTVSFEAECAAGCNCQDHLRREAACKHMLAAEMFITGNVPEPMEAFVAGLPVPPFDVETEAALLAQLEAAEEERASGRTSEEESWSFARGFLAGCGIDTRAQDPALRDRELLWPAA